MGAIITMLIAAGLLLGFPGDALAVDEGFSKALKHMEIKGESGGNMTWTIVILVGVVAAVIVLVKILNRTTQERQKAPIKAVKKQKQVDFKKHAVKMGFQIAEIKSLRTIATRIAPSDPGVLLATDVGRERLAADIWERIRRRDREIEVLRGIQEKLDRMRDHKMQERQTIRVETNLPVWIIKKSVPGAEVEEEEEEGEEIFSDVEQIGGRLLDLSEGGAALTAELDAGVKDLIEFWSADSEIWIPPITAGVLQVKESPDGRGPVFHLHFLDPPLSELRAAIQTLQMEASIHAP